MDCSTPGLPAHHQFPESTQTHVHWVSDAIQPLIFCHPLLCMPSIFPSIRVFSNESALRIRWPKYWSFSINISPPNEHPGLISFRMDWLDLLAVQGTLKSPLQHHSSKASVPSFSAKGQWDFQGSFLVICAYWPTSLKILKTSYLKNHCTNPEGFTLQVSLVLGKLDSYT